jgi:hypothetical protein
LSPPDPTSAWTLSGFEECLDRWVADNQPDVALHDRVILWVFTRDDNPYQGVARAEGFDNLWYGRIPGTLHAVDRVVVCSYFIRETSRTVECVSFASLRLPV